MPCFQQTRTHLSVAQDAETRAFVFVFLLSALVAYTIMLRRQDSSLLITNDDVHGVFPAVGAVLVFIQKTHAQHRRRVPRESTERETFLCSLGVSIWVVCALLRTFIRVYEQNERERESERESLAKSKLAAPLFAVLNKLGLCYGQNAFSTSL